MSEKAENLMIVSSWMQRQEFSRDSFQVVKRIRKLHAGFAHNECVPCDRSFIKPAYCALHTALVLTATLSSDPETVFDLTMQYRCRLLFGIYRC